MEKESYLLELSRYIVLNPVRSKLVHHPCDWRWSSYRARAGEEGAPTFLTVDWILSQLHQYRDRVIREYRKFVKAGYGINVWEELRGGVILGTERFVEELKPLLQERAPAREIPRKERLAARPGLKELFSGIKDNSDRDERIYQSA